MYLNFVDSFLIIVSCSLHPSLFCSPCFPEILLSENVCGWLTFWVFALPSYLNASLGGYKILGLILFFILSMLFVFIYLVLKENFPSTFFFYFSGIPMRLIWKLLHLNFMTLHYVLCFSLFGGRRLSSVLGGFLGSIVQFCTVLQFCTSLEPIEWIFYVVKTR